MAEFLTEVRKRIRSIAPGLGIEAAEIEAAMKQKGRGRLGPLFDFAVRHELSLNYLLLGEGPPLLARHYAECPSCGSKNAQARWAAAAQLKPSPTSGHGSTARRNSDGTCKPRRQARRGFYLRTPYGLISPEMLHVIC